MNTPTSTELREAVVHALTDLGEATAGRIELWLHWADPSGLYDRGRIEHMLEEDGHIFMPSAGLLWGLGPKRWRLRSAGAAGAGRSSGAARIP